MAEMDSWTTIPSSSWSLVNRWCLKRYVTASVVSLPAFEKVLMFCASCLLPSDAATQSVRESLRALRDSHLDDGDNKPETEKLIHALSAVPAAGSRQASVSRQSAEELVSNSTSKNGTDVDHDKFIAVTTAGVSK